MSTSATTDPEPGAADATASGVDHHVVLVDAMGEPIGTMPKLAAHAAPGHWHTAFSVMLMDPDGRLLLQRRAAGKYHFAGRWSNSCCSHPRPGESVAEAVQRRVPEELGVEVGNHPTRLVGSFFYTAVDPASGLQEREYDQVVVIGDVDPSSVEPDPAEVADVAWTTLADARDRCTDPDAVTPWLAQVLDLVAAHPDLDLGA